MNNPTVIVITDRNDLDDQLFDTLRIILNCCVNHLNKPKAQNN